MSNDLMTELEAMRTMVSDLSSDRSPENRARVAALHRRLKQMKQTLPNDDVLAMASFIATSRDILTYLL